MLRLLPVLSGSGRPRLFSQGIGQKVGHLLVPPEPAVIHIKAPVVHSGPNTFAQEYLLQAAGSCQGGFLSRSLPAAEHHTPTVEHINIGVVQSHAGQADTRVVGIGHLIHIALVHPIGVVHA